MQFWNNYECPPPPKNKKIITIFETLLSLLAELNYHTFLIVIYEIHYIFNTLAVLIGQMI